MKKCLALLLSFCVVFYFTACGSVGKNHREGIAKDHREDIAKAIDEVSAVWKQIYLDDRSEEFRPDGYLEIKNTRVINIKENEIEEFDNVKCIVEFILYTDYFASAPYYCNVGMNDTIMIFHDGTVEVTPKNPIEQYRIKYYTTDYSEFIDSIEDYHDKQRTA